VKFLGNGEIRDNIVIGTDAFKYAIAGTKNIIIGNNAGDDIAEAHNMFVLSYNGKDFRTEMTDKEWKVMKTVILRALGKK